MESLLPPPGELPQAGLAPGGRASGRGATAAARPASHVRLAGHRRRCRRQGPSADARARLGGADARPVRPPDARPGGERGRTARRAGSGRRACAAGCGRVNEGQPTKPAVNLALERARAGPADRPTAFISPQASTQWPQQGQGRSPQGQPHSGHGCWGSYAIGLTSFPRELGLAPPPADRLVRAILEPGEHGAQLAP